MRTSIARLVLGALTVVALTGARAADAIPFSWGGFTWEQDDTPDVLGLLGDGVTLGGASFSALLPDRITRSVGFEADPSDPGNESDGFNGLPGFDPALSIGRQAYAQHGITQSDGTPCLFACALNLPRATENGTDRHGIEVSWSGGRTLANAAGDDFVLYESASSSTGSETMMVRARVAGTGAFTSWYYQGVDSYQVYDRDPVNSDGAMGYAFDLSDLGVAGGIAIDLIQVANLKSSDRLDVIAPFATSGFVVFGSSDLTLAKPSDQFRPSGFGSSSFDPDPLWIAGLHELQGPPPQESAPEPGTLTLLAAGAAGMHRLARRRLRG